MPITLNSLITEIPGVGPVYARKLNKLGIKTARDLLFYFPRQWDDYSKLTSISKVKLGEQVSVKGVIIDIATKRSRRGIPITEMIISDGSGSAKAVWFNQSFIEKNLKKGEEIYLSGKLEWGFGQLNFVSPAYEKKCEAEDELRHTARIVPIYPETAGLSSKWLREKISLLAKLIYGIKDHLPEEVKKHHNLLELSAAVRSMHFPESEDELKSARKRFLYDDLFCLFISVLSNKKIIEKEKSVVVDYNEEEGRRFVSSLSYELTNAQKKAAWEILRDLKRPTPMNRLLEGDVGSGKTVVAAMAMLMVAKSGYQTVLLAPTEILARQHYENLKKILLDFDIKISLLTGSAKSAQKKKIYQEIESGEIQILVGTHAVFAEGLNFWTLALVVVDEQHRFGVEQRMRLKKANGTTKLMPHFLSMSATPIPRTLAITIFGDLSLSVIDEMPPGRERVDTHIVPSEKRGDGYEFIDKKIGEGRQAFIICPLIEKSDKLGVKSVLEEYENLKEIFPKRKLAFIHGRQSSQEKAEIMTEFQQGAIDILISTSIVEVGVDVPNASIMVIEDADRFGLAQLHQFRGRVGRGKHKSYCFLFFDSKNKKTIERLNALTRLESGFSLAEKDLELRGPGELLGIKQHGKVSETLIKVLKTPRIINEVRQTADLFLDKEGLKNYPLLKEKVDEFLQVANLE